MAIKRKTKEVLLNQAKGFFEHEVNAGKITEEKKEEIFGILSKKDVDISDKEQIKEQLQGVLNPDEFEKLYGEYIDYYKDSYKVIREWLKRINLFPVKYIFLNNKFINALLKDDSMESFLEGIKKVTNDDVDLFVNMIKTNIGYFESLSLSKNDMGNLDFNFIFEEDIVEMKKIIKQLEIRGINMSVDNLNKLVDIITGGSADRIISNMKILRDEFGIDGVDDFSKLAKIIKRGYDTDKIEKNMKMLRDEFGIDGVDDFSKLADLITDREPERIEKIMKMLRDEFGINGADGFSKFTDIIKHGDQDIIKKNMKILKDEFGIDGIDNLSKLAYLITSSNSDQMERNMKMLRDKFGIDGVDNFAKLKYIINYGDTDKIEKNMKMLKDEFGIDGVDNFAKLQEIIGGYYPDTIERIMKMLRDEFGIDGVDNFAKLQKIINGFYGFNLIEKNMKMLRDELGIDGVDNFAKLAKIISEGYDSDKIKRIMKKLRDELGIDGVDNFAKLEDLITSSNSDQIEKNMNIFRYEFEIYGADDFFKWEYFIKNLKLPVPSDFKEKNHVGYLKFLNEIIDTNYDSDKKCKMIEKVVTLTFEQAENYLEVFKMLDDSISMDIQRIKNELIDELLKTDNPKEIAQQIINIFERNNLPLTGKIFKVFELLYPKEKFKATLQSHGSPVLHKYLDEGNNFYDLIYRDLMNIAIKSGDRSLRDYLSTFVGSEELLKNFEKIISSEGFDGNDPLCLQGKFDEKDREKDEEAQAKLLYLFRKMSVLYNRYFGKEINEGNTIEDKKYGESTVADNQLVEFYNDIKKGFHLRKGESIYDRLQRFLWGLGYHSFNEVLKDMNESKKQAHERGLNLYNEAMNNGGKIIFPKGAFLKGVDENAFSKIINRGVTCREYLGGGDDGKAAGSDATPFDIDGIYVDSPTKWTGYGNINLVVNTEKSNIYDTRKQGIEGYTENKYELFETCGGSPAHYGIRTGVPMTEVDYIIYHGDFTEKEFEYVCYEIVRNGYYIPVTDNEGNIKFTPEMYHQIRAGFNYMQYYDGFDVREIGGKYKMSESDNEIHRTDSDEELNALISKNSPTNEKYITFAEENRDLAENTIKWIMEILENECGIKFNSKHDSSITGAELHDSGSTGRGTDIPTKDVDLDFTLILDAKDYERVNEIKKIIHERIGTQKDDDHDVQEGGNQIKSKINNIGISDKRPNGVPLDLLILKKSQVIDYSSSDAMKEKLDYIKDNLGEEDYNFVRTNVIIMKKLLKAKGCYKKPEGGIAGIGVENWIIQNHGNFIEALESFEQVAYGGKYEEGKQPKPLSQFQKLYPIYDAGENYKDGGNDNFVYKLEQNGYEGTLEIIKAYRLNGIKGIENIIKEYEEKKDIFIN